MINILSAEAQKQAALRYYGIAKDVEEEMTGEQQEDKKTALRMVSGQNYFYAGVEAIESVLRRNGVVVNDHKDRINKIQLNHRLFKKGEQLVLKHSLVTQEGLNYRRRVAYKGENGNKFITLKDFSETAMKEI